MNWKCRQIKCIYPINCERLQDCLSIVKEKPMGDTDNDKDRNRYGIEDLDDRARSRHGSPLFYELLQKMAETHDRKSHDYASNDNPFGNYHFAGKLSKLFDNPDDAGFVGRIGEKFYRLANLENNGKEVAVKDEGMEDTENDICVITLLWMVDRRNRRLKARENKLKQILNS